MEVSGQLHAPAALPPEKGHLVPIGQEAGWTPEPVWTPWWRGKFRAPAGNQTPDLPARNPALSLLGNEFQDNVCPCELHVGYKQRKCEINSFHASLLLKGIRNVPVLAFYIVMLLNKIKQFSVFSYLCFGYS
jgi:hypothetical protein